MSETAERGETLNELELVAFRRMGANRVHFALVMPATIQAVDLVVPLYVLTGAVSAFCSRTLRGTKFVIPDEYLDEWRKQGHICRECELTARIVLAKAEAQS